jgi:hypothetical protein
MTVLEMKLTPGVRKLLEGKPDIEKGILSPSLDRLADKTVTIIKKPGMAPRDEGHFAARHQADKSHPTRKKIINPVRVENGRYLWTYIVNGHMVLTTEKARKWWFWHLKNELGGKYTRKTPGQSVMGPGGKAVGYVPPDRYPARAVAELVNSGQVDKIVLEEFRRYFHGGK